MREKSCIAVTSFNQSGYDRYGKRMLKSFQEYWPDDIRIVAVSEDPVEVETNDRLIFEAYSDIAPEGDIFKNKFAKFSEANGRSYEDDGPNSINIMYDYRFDAIRFSHKVFSLFGVSRRYDADYMIWIDADTFSFAPIDDAFFDGIDPGDGHMTYLGRKEMYSECGFLVFNRRSPVHDLLMTTMTNEYLSGDIFLLPEWHDSYLWDFYRTYFEQAHPHTNRSISGSGDTSLHPFVLSVLGKYMDHLKGPERKEIGRSFDDDWTHE